MPNYRITAPDGRTFNVTAPEGATEQEVMSRVQREAADTAPATFESVTAPLKRAGRLFVGAEAPDAWTDYVALAAMNAPLMLAGGAGGAAALGRTLGPRVASGLGRVATSMGLGGGQAAVRGEGLGGITLSALLDGVIAGLSEGLVSAGTSGVKAGPIKLGLKEWGAPQQAFEYATSSPVKMLETIEANIPKGAMLNVPTLSPNPIPVREAVTELVKREGPSFALAHKQIASELDRLQPHMGAVFTGHTSPARFAPGPLAKGAEATRKGITSDEVRAAVDALTVSPLAEGFPMGAAIGAAVAPSITKKIPGLGNEERRTGGGGY